MFIKILGLFVLFLLPMMSLFSEVENSTKIICTLGPSTNTKEKIAELIDAGMDVARLNFSHGSHAEHAELISRLKEVRNIKGKALAILLDTKGPEIRVGQLPGGYIELKEGEKYWLVEEVERGRSDQIPINPFSIVKDLEEGMMVLFNDGAISSTILSIEPGKGILIRVNNTSRLASKKGINIPNATLSLPNLMEQDIKDIRFGCRQGVDVIALSFTRSADLIHEVRKILAEEGREEVLLIAKIENWQGIENLENIIQAADGIMVARGDLGVELPLSQVPKLQKKMIYKSFLGGKPSTTATQMLESMIDNPRPTRAEVSDVANAVYDSSSSVMLSGETAVGKYPIECVKVMRTIVSETEKDFDFEGFFAKTLKLPSYDITSSIAIAAVRCAYNSGAKAIFSLTDKGEIVRFLSRLRPPVPILVFTSNEAIYNQLALYWGVTPQLISEQDSLEDLSRLAVEKGFVQKGDLVILTSSTTEDKWDGSDFMMMKTVGNALFRGSEGYGRSVRAKMINVSDPKETNVSNKIAVISICNREFEPVFKRAAGVILQNLNDDKFSEEYAKKLWEKYHTPLIMGVESNRFFQDGQWITLEPGKAVGFVDRF